jgi:hypothetical protein
VPLPLGKHKREYICEQQKKTDRMGKVLSISNHKGGVGKQLRY